MVKPPKIEIFEKVDKPAPSNIEHLVEISICFMTLSTVWHPETLTPSSILIFKAHLLVLVSDFFIRFQRDVFKNRLKLELFLSFGILFIVNQQILLILWYGVAASSFFPRFSVFLIFSDHLFLDFYFFEVIFVFEE